MPTAAKKTTAKKTTAAPPKPAPLVDLAADAHDPDAVERLDLFEVGGVMYTIPAESSVSVLIQYMDLEDDFGATKAMWWLFNELLGPDGVRALKSYRRLTRAHIKQLHLACLDAIRGPKA